MPDPFAPVRLSTSSILSNIKNLPFLTIGIVLAYIIDELDKKGSHPIFKQIYRYFLKKSYLSH